MTFIIYLITNTVNGKGYVGRTGMRLSKRWRCHLSDARNNKKQPLYCAIRKYGESNFSCEPILTVNTLEEAAHQERIWILLLGAHVSQYGYVCTWGGDGHTGRSQEQAKAVEKLVKVNKTRVGILSNLYNPTLDSSKMVSLYEEGNSLTKISKIMGCSPSCVTDRLTKVGVSPWNPTTFNSSFSTEKIIELYEEGRSLKEVGKIIGCSSGTVRKRLVKAKIARNSRSFRSKKEAI